MKYLLDTDHISILQRQTGTEYAVLSSRISRLPLTEFAFSLISFHEQALGCHAYLNRARNVQDVVKGYGMFAQVLQDFVAAPVLPFDALAAAAFNDLLARRVRVATMDLRIAAIALSRGMMLLTRNVRDFSKVPGLQHEDWTT